MLQRCIDFKLEDKSLQKECLILKAKSKRRKGQQLSVWAGFSSLSNTSKAGNSSKVSSTVTTIVSTLTTNVEEEEAASKNTESKLKFFVKSCRTR